MSVKHKLELLNITLENLLPVYSCCNQVRRDCELLRQSSPAFDKVLNTYISCRSLEKDVVGVNLTNLVAQMIHDGDSVSPPSCDYNHYITEYVVLLEMVSKEIGLTLQLPSMEEQIPSQGDIFDIGQVMLKLRIAKDLLSSIKA